MPIASEKSGDFIPAPAGTHVARCVDVISLGTQTSELFPAAFKVMIGWELPDEGILVNGEARPMKVSKEFTLSLSKKANLRKSLEGWRGRPFTEDELKGFEVAEVLSHPCLLTIIHKTSGQGRVYAAIESVSGLAKGMICKPQVHSSLQYEIEQGRNAAFKNLPEWIQKKIEACEEWLHPPIDREEPALEPKQEDDVPF